MSEAQQLFLKLSQLVQKLLQQLPHWWNLPIVLMLFYQFQQRNYLMRNNLFDSYPCNFSGPKYACQDPVVGHVSLGCFVNNKNIPFPYLFKKDGITKEQCVQHCKEINYPYAGFNQCGKCFCGENLFMLKRCKKRPRRFKPRCGTSSPPTEVFRTMYCTERMKNARSHDGTCNDLNQPASGSRFYRFGRNVNRTKTFEDKDLLKPCPRELSRRLLTREEFIPVKQLNLFAAAWIQFNVHDWFDHGSADTSRRIKIKLNRDNDPVYKEHRGWMKIARTKSDNCRKFSDKGSPKTFQNDVTHWWDGSQLYGSDEETNAKVRSFKEGKLKLGKDGLLPVDPKTGIDITGFSKNWWVGLSLMHNIFTREHNTICDMLKRYYPEWSDQQLYDKARLINVAVILKIHSIEWTPAILNNTALRAGLRLNFGLSPGKEVYDWLKAHNISVDSSGAVLTSIVGKPSEFHGVPFSLTEEFVSVYRMHPLLPDYLHIGSFSAGQGTGRTYQLPEYSFRGTRDVLVNNNMEDILFTFGVEHPGALTLHNYPTHLMNLKLPNHQQKGETIDLATIEILRDRERGIPRYNDFRRLTNLRPVESFEKLTPNRKHSNLLKEIYKDIEKLDLLIGCLAEQPRPDGFGFGETAFNIFLAMASRRLQTDRFMTDDYTPDIYTPEGLKWIQDTDMRSVLTRAFPDIAWMSDVLSKSDNAFFPWPIYNENLAG